MNLHFSDARQTDLTDALGIVDHDAATSLPVYRPHLCFLVSWGFCLHHGRLPSISKAVLEPCQAGERRITFVLLQ